MRRRSPIFPSLAFLLLAATATAAWAAAGLAADGPIAEARARVAAGDPAGALDPFERALEAEPNNLRYGAEYRQAAIAAERYDRSIDFFEKLVADHPDAANAWLNCGYAYVDKIPAAGAVTQVILANTAIERFGSALGIDDTWLGRYTRGNSYVYWPPIFERTKLGIADLEKAIEIAKDLPKKPYRARAWIALGDGWWRLDDLDKARRVWRRGLARYPGNAALQKRLSLPDDELATFLEGQYEIGQRVSTDLHELWEAE